MYLFQNGYTGMPFYSVSWRCACHMLSNVCKRLYPRRRFYSHPVFVYWYIFRALSLLNIFKIQDQPCVRFVSFLISINWCCWFGRSVSTRPFFRKLSLGYYFFKKSFFNFVSELNQEKAYDKAVDISGNLLFSDWTRTVYQVNNWSDYRDGSLIIGVSLLQMIS